ncbi:MAG TPA: hypothetical protein VN599_09250 [Rudaea sp.]|nr:hypothetical protein [Rudaea sp.]
MKLACRIFGGVIAVCLSTLSAAADEPNAAACVAISTAAQLQAIKNVPTRVYCLTADIDLSSIPNFVPIGSQAKPFTGQFLGKNHVISNLTTNSSANAVGLFGWMDGTIKDVNLRNVNISSTGAAASVGGVAGIVIAGFGLTATADNVSVSGRIACTGGGCAAGGIVGDLDLNSTLSDSWSSASVSGNGEAGGAVGNFNQNGIVRRTFATGPVDCSLANCISAGGFAGAVFGSGPSLSDIYSTGRVTGSPGLVTGGLIGDNAGTITRAFASGEVAVTAGTIGSLFGDNSGTVSQCYGIGALTGGFTVGGVAGSNTGSVTNCYWDKNTTGAATSPVGTGLTTVQLRQMLPGGFLAGWAITKTLSYPYLNNVNFIYFSPLATLVQNNKVFVSLPISQFDNSQYTHKPAHPDGAALATVYTMIGRAVGITEHLATLQGANATIDRYYWHDATQKTTYSGPVTHRATLGPLTNIAAAAHLNGTNVVHAFNHQQLAILRGTFTKSGKKVEHWMLGTLYVTGAGNVVTSITANDPYTGEQVEISPTTKKVVKPKNFPLTTFVVDGYQTVTVN